MIFTESGAWAIHKLPDEMQMAYGSNVNGIRTVIGAPGASMVTINRRVPGGIVKRDELGYLCL